MIVVVRVADKTFSVELGDLSARPVQAVVDGECFEVWPEEVQAETDRHASQPPGEAPSVELAGVLPAITVRPSRRTSGAATLAPGLAAKAVLAPISGVVESIAVEEGMIVEEHQELCVLAAMKMANSVRAPRLGEIERVHVSPGQHVKRGDVLVTFAAEH